MPPPKPKNPPVPPAIGGGSGGDDPRGVWGTTRELHLKVTAHRKEMREVRDNRLYRDFQAFSRRRDAERERARTSTVALLRAPVDESRAAPTSAPSRPPRDDGEDPLLLLIRTVDEAAQTLGVERRGVWSEMGKPYRAGGGAPVAHVPRDVRELLPSRIAPADPAALARHPDARPPPADAAAAELAPARDQDAESDEPLDEMLADVGYGRGIFAPRNISDDEAATEGGDRDADADGHDDDDDDDDDERENRPSDAASERSRVSTRPVRPFDPSSVRFPRELLDAVDARRRAVKGGSRGGGGLAAETSRTSTASLASTATASVASPNRGGRKKGAKVVGKSDGWREDFIAVRERKNEQLREMLRRR